MSKIENLNNTETIVESDTDDNCDVKTLEKQKRPKTDAQIKAFEKARLVRAENILRRQEERNKEKEDFDKLKEMKKQIKELKVKKEREKELKQIHDPDDDTSDSDNEIVVKKVVPTYKKKVQKKKKVIYIDENDDDDDMTNDRNVIIVNKMPAINQHPAVLSPAVRPRPKAIFL